MDAASSRIRFILRRLGERLWVKPLTYCVLSIGGAFIAKALDARTLPSYLPVIEKATNEALLSVMAASMLVIATLAVTSMVSAYASASTAATPRSFPVVVADDVSQNALSTYLGAFIFSIVALIAVKNDFYSESGHFVLFVLTLVIFTWVVITFVRWVDAIARLGRLVTAIRKVERSAADALERRARQPTLGGVAISELPGDADERVTANSIGYVQQVDIPHLQAIGNEAGIELEVVSLPGKFVGLNDTLAAVHGKADIDSRLRKEIAGAFRIGSNRVFDEDPRFGLIVLSEIASKALSPAVNDPGTAIDIIGTLTRLFMNWQSTGPERGDQPGCDRVYVPALSVDDLFDDAFAAIGRDGAGHIEVAIRLQKALAAIAGHGGEDVTRAATRQAKLAYARSEQAFNVKDDLDRLRATVTVFDP